MAPRAELGPEGGCISGREDIEEEEDSNGFDCCCDLGPVGGADESPRGFFLASPRTASEEEPFVCDVDLSASVGETLAGSNVFDAGAPFACCELDREELGRSGSELLGLTSTSVEAGLVSAKDGLKGGASGERPDEDGESCGACLTSVTLAAEAEVGAGEP